MGGEGKRAGFKRYIWITCWSTTDVLLSQQVLSEIVGIKCRLRRKLSHRLIRDNFSIIGSRNKCRSRFLCRENFQIGLFIIVTIENLYLFLNLKHKVLVITFTVLGIRIKAL